MQQGEYMKSPVTRYTDKNNTLKVETFYHIVAEPGENPWSFPLHLHDDLLEISLITNGRALFECDHARYVLEQGDLVVKNAGVLHSEISSPHDGFEQYCLGISGVFEDGMPPNTLVPEGVSPVIHTGSAFDFLRSMTAYLYELRADSSVNSSDLIRQAVENELSLINMLILNAAEATWSDEYCELVASAVEYIDTHVGETMSLESLSKQFYVSTYHLAHKFKDDVGCTVNQYILNRKLGEVQRRLVFTDDPIKEIAADCGYTSLQYFYSVFKKNVGCTPVEIRNYYNRVRAGAR